MERNLDDQRRLPFRNVAKRSAPSWKTIAPPLALRKKAIPCRACDLSLAMEAKWPNFERNDIFSCLF